MALEDRPTTSKTRVVTRRRQLLRLDKEDTHDVDAETGRRLVQAVAERLDPAPAAVFWETDWRDVAESLGRTDLGLIGLALACNFASAAVRTWRWRLLLLPLDAAVSLGSAWRCYNIGFAVSSVLPGRLGEVLRPWLMARERDLPFASPFATVVTERVVDLLAVLSMLATVLVLPGALGTDATTGEGLGLVTAIRAFAGVALGAALGLGAGLVVLSGRAPRWPVG